MLDMFVKTKLILTKTFMNKKTTIVKQFSIRSSQGDGDYKLTKVLELKTEFYQTEKR